MSLSATPIGLSVISTLDGSCLRISWYPVSAFAPWENISGYYLYRSEIAYGDFAQIVSYSSLPGLTYFDTPPTPNDNLDNQWWYRVSSFDGLVESRLSGPATYLNYAAFDEKPVPGVSWSSLF